MTSTPRVIEKIYGSGPAFNHGFRKYDHNIMGDENYISLMDDFDSTTSEILHYDMILQFCSRRDICPLSHAELSSSLTKYNKNCLFNCAAKLSFAEVLLARHQLLREFELVSTNLNDFKPKDRPVRYDWGEELL